MLLLLFVVFINQLLIKTYSIPNTYNINFTNVNIVSNVCTRVSINLICKRVGMYAIIGCIVCILSVYKR